jgi:hypothetical protein
LTAFNGGGTAAEIGSGFPQPRHLVTAATTGEDGMVMAYESVKLSKGLLLDDQETS